MKRLNSNSQSNFAMLSADEQEHLIKQESVDVEQYFRNKYVPFLFLIDRELNIHYSNLSQQHRFFYQIIKNPKSLEDLFGEEDIQIIQTALKEVDKENPSLALREVKLFSNSISVQAKIKFTLCSTLDLSDHQNLIELSITETKHESSKNEIEIQQLKNELEEMRLENRRLLKINKYLDDFVIGAAHDLRGPLVVLKSYVDLIRRFKTESKKIEALDNMKSATIRFENVIMGLVESVEFQKKGLNKCENLSFQKLYELTKFQLSTQIEKCKPEISISFEKAPDIYYIKSFLTSILYNLLSNALKYKQDNQSLRINVKTRKEGEFIVLSVRDNGIGMDLTQCANQLFEPFQRLTTKASGIGIGLSMINRMVQENGGYINVDSQLGLGTCFSVYLKAYPE